MEKWTSFSPTYPQRIFPTAPQQDRGKPPASLVRTAKRGVQQNYAKANRAPLPASAAKTYRFKRSPKGHAKSTVATPRLQAQSRLSQCAKKGSIRNKLVTSPSAVQRQSMFPSASPSLDTLRHRGPDPAVIGGLGTSKPNETGAINGSHINRRP